MDKLFDSKDILTVATADQAVVGTKGYFGDNLVNLIADVRQGKVETLTDVTPDVTYCFQSNNALHHAFFLPADRVEKPYRALESIDELFDFFYSSGSDGVYKQTKKAKILVGRKIVLKDKILKRIRVMVIQSVEFSEDSDDNSNVYLNCFSLNELFNTYEIQIKGEWVPFGIKK